MQISNLTLDEYLLFHEDKVPRQLLDLIHGEVGGRVLAESEKEDIERDLEGAEEQVDFAKNLLEAIDAAVRPVLKGKALVAYEEALSNSLFER